MTIRKYLLAAVLVVSFSSFALATPEKAETVEEKIASFRLFGDIAPAGTPVPTVVEIPLETLPFSRTQTAVFDVTEHVFVPHTTIQKRRDTTIPVQVVSNKSRGNDAALSDRDFETHMDFDLPKDSTGEAILTFTAETPFAADTLCIGLADHVAMPENIEIRAEVDGVQRIVVAEKDGRGVCPRCVLFPETVSSKWQVKLRYGQPLRIAEVAFQQTNEKVSEVSLRFLSQPGHTYRIFRDADRSITISTGESGDLRADKDIVHLPLVTLKHNPSYQESDLDKDRIVDSRDNCVLVPNTDQADINGNLRGDACDDYDRDGIINSKDNCPNLPNVAQQDADSDGIGDACDKEESRVTERYSWLPWVALGSAAILMLFFFFRVAKATPPKDMS